MLLGDVDAVLLGELEAVLLGEELDAEDVGDPVEEAEALPLAVADALPEPEAPEAPHVFLTSSTSWVSPVQFVPGGT